MDRNYKKASLNLMLGCPWWGVLEADSRPLAGNARKIMLPVLRPIKEGYEFFHLIVFQER
jgi:hypothetical protein